jgi:hypothetical protein
VACLQVAAWRRGKARERAEYNRPRHSAPRAVFMPRAAAQHLTYSSESSEYLQPIRYSTGHSSECDSWRPRRSAMKGTGSDSGVGGPWEARTTQQLVFSEPQAVEHRGVLAQHLFNREPR